MVITTTKVKKSERLKAWRNIGIPVKKKLTNWLYLAKRISWSCSLHHVQLWAHHRYQAQIQIVAAAVACKAQNHQSLFGCFENRAKSKSRLCLSLQSQVARLAALSEDDYVGQAARLERCGTTSSPVSLASSLFSPGRTFLFIPAPHFYWKQTTTFKERSCVRIAVYD